MRIPTIIQDHKKLLLIGGGVALLVASIVVFLAFRPQTLAYSYGGDACDKRLVLLPELLKSEGAEYALTTKNPLKVGNWAVAAREVCAQALVAPEQGKKSSARLSLAGGPLFSLRYTIAAPEKPKVTAQLDAPIATAKPLKIALSAADTTFSYKLAVSGRQVACQPQQKALLCDVTPLNLPQGETHLLALERSFKNKKIDTPLTREVTTQSPTTITGISVASGAVVYDTPKEIIVTADKPLSEAKARLEKTGDTPEEIATKTTIKGSDVRVTYETDLPRESEFRLITELIAEDGSSLQAPHETTFTTSGGPKVTGTSIGASGYIPGTPIVIKFDQPVKEGTDIAKFVDMKGISGSLALRGQEIVLTPQAVNRCQQFSLVVKKGLVSQYDITSSSDWSFSSRARCYTTATIGTSVQGRPITAYYFGNGPTHILYTGAIHGNELSSKYIMESWISELDGRAGDIPADKTLVIVPVANPDGAAIGQRNNARGVNLNRNFATGNWMKDIQTGNGFRPGEGGGAAGSEPEAQALANVTRQINPALVVTFHSSGSLVNSNDAGSSIAKGRQYANLAGYSFIPNSATTGTFGFEMTGTYEDWLLERGTAAFLIELNTNYGNHFAQNRTALWSTMQ